MSYKLQDTSSIDARIDYMNDSIKDSKRSTKSRKSRKSSKSNKSLTLNNLLHFKDIFSHNRKYDNSLILLKKQEFDIFYSCKRKYPLLVKETVTRSTGFNDPNEPRIIRSKGVDPWNEDTDIPEKYRYSIDNYEQGMKYGISMGHNAPAGQHKTNMSIFSETFLLSNITPQEMVFNSGLWALFENWCHELQRNTKLSNINIFTGSIPDTRNISIHDVSMNVPTKMFKIICFQHENKPNVTFMDIFIANNKPYYVNSKIDLYDLGAFILPSKSYRWFENYTGIDINTLLEYYSINTSNIRTFKNTIPVSITLSHNLKLLMKKSNWYGYLIYVKNVEELENRWEQCKLLNKEFGNLEFHQKFYEATKARLSSTQKIDPLLTQLFNQYVNIKQYINQNTNQRTNKHTYKHTNQRTNKYYPSHAKGRSKRTKKNYTYKYKSKK